ncbi:cfap36 [Symbiodinium natans]|uniref:Cilia- and flagella-associated protein 36 n=1 Tax=Symbiodinium natans TaxID=878477 RepID=A0A812SZT9_9DINO|nr:cfap36 [Symbiodinium natans]
MVPISQFVDTNCLCFEDHEENKLEYTLVHNAFKQLVEDLLAAHMAELHITTEEFTSFCEYGLSGSNELHRSLVEQLISVDDFLVFKAMMLKRNSELSRESLNPIGQIVVADSATPAPPHVETAELETEAERLARLEAEQRCVEAELQLAIALSRHLEKRLQLIEALNEVLEMAAHLSAHAESMSAQAEAEAAQQAALAAAQMIQQQQEQFSLPPTLQIQPLLDGGVGAAPVMQEEDPYAEERRRMDAAEQQERAQIAVAQASAARRQAEQNRNPQQPSEEERQARAEHLRQRREALMEKKRRERELELNRFTELNGHSTAARAAERACAGQPALPEDAGRKLADELRGNVEPDGPQANPEEAAIAMRRALTAQLKQTLTQSLH